MNIRWVPTWAEKATTGVEFVETRFADFAAGGNRCRRLRENRSGDRPSAANKDRETQYISGANDASLAPHRTASSDHGHEESKFQIYVQIAMLLAVITGAEIITVYLPFAKWLLVSSLIILSAVKFLFVIFIFMHLRWDKVFCTVLFFIGLVLAGGTMWALLKLFAAASSLPITSS